MKTFKGFLMILLIACFGLAISSCGNSKKAESKTSNEQLEKIDKSGKEYTSAYICPMHCKDSGSDKAGECPVCGMDYKENKDLQKDDHSHEGHDHSGHDHSGHSH